MNNHEITFNHLYVGILPKVIAFALHRKTAGTPSRLRKVDHSREAEERPGHREERITQDVDSVSTQSTMEAKSTELPRPKLFQVAVIPNQATSITTTDPLASTMRMEDGTDHVL